MQKERPESGRFASPDRELQERLFSIFNTGSAALTFLDEARSDHAYVRHVLEYVIASADRGLRMFSGMQSPRTDYPFLELDKRYGTLTNREKQVLPYVTAGLLNKQTAAELGVSEVTVRIHRGQIMRKMQAQSLAHLVRMSDRLGVSCDQEL